MAERKLPTLVEERDIQRLRPHLRTRGRRSTLRACLGCGRPCATTPCSSCRPTRASYNDVEYQANRIIVLTEEKTCWHCGKPGTKADPLTVDHKTSLAAGGTHRRLNLAAAHRSCNARSGARRAA